MTTQAHLYKRDDDMQTAWLVEAAKNAKPMTPEQRFEQQVSWVFGQVGGSLTKEEISQRLKEPQ